jgi:hypothetical protein
LEQDGSQPIVSPVKRSITKENIKKELSWLITE